MATRLPPLFAAFLLMSSDMPAQTAASGGGAKVEILNADEWSFDERIAPGAQRLRGNVRFKHAGALMHCDSAHLYQDQRVEAFGRVRILQGDTLEVRGDRSHYDGGQRIARMEGQVSLRNPDMELMTPSLDYDLKGKRAVYTEGGRIVEREDGSVLTSRNGTYQSDTRTFIFSRNVRLEHPERIITTDTMHYMTATGIASFIGPTHIHQQADSSVLRTRRGTYDTRTGQARFTRRSSILSKGRLLKGDTLHYDRGTGIGLAWGNVSVTDSAGNMIVYGQHGRYDERDERSMITGRAELVFLMDSDSLFLHADTLFTLPDDRQAGKGGHRNVTAYRNVRFFKSDMQGVCDTLVYSGADSLIRMFHHPALWSGNDQITGTHIRIQLANGSPHRLFVEGDGFLLSQADSVHFDQVTGSSMTGTFSNGELRHILADGNARTVYFARENKNGEEVLMGVNRADCSRIAVALTEGRISTVTFMERPDAILYPLDKAPAEELRMKGAHWRIEERPMERAAIFEAQR